MYPRQLLKQFGNVYTKDQKKALKGLKEYCAGEQKLLKFSLNGMNTFAYPYSIYDGDTLNLVIMLNGKPARFACRTLGYNSAELRTNDENEKKKGYAAKEYFSKLICDKSGNYQVIWAEFGQNDKYGRPLVTLYNIDKNSGLPEDKSINEQMIEGGHGAEYYGVGEKKF